MTFNELNRIQPHLRFLFDFSGLNQELLMRHNDMNSFHAIASGSQDLTPEEFEIESWDLMETSEILKIIFFLLHAYSTLHVRFLNRYVFKGYKLASLMEIKGSNGLPFEEEVKRKDRQVENMRRLAESEFAEMEMDVKNELYEHLKDSVPNWTHHISPM